MQANDRGTKKWTALMLTEHQEALRKLFNEKEYKEKPVLAEDQIAEININLQHALEHDLLIEIEYFKNNDYHKINGHLLGVDPLNNILIINDEHLPLDSVTGASIDGPQY